MYTECIDSFYLWRFIEKDLDILTSDIKKIDGIEQIRIYAESPDRTTGRFKKFEMYLPKENVTLLEGYTKEELLNITTIISQCKSIIWDLARYYSAGGR